MDLFIKVSGLKGPKPDIEMWKRRLQEMLDAGEVSFDSLALAPVEEPQVVVVYEDGVEGGVYSNVPKFVLPYIHTTNLDSEDSEEDFKEHPHRLEDVELVEFVRSSEDYKELSDES